MGLEQGDTILSLINVIVFIFDPKLNFLFLIDDASWMYVRLRLLT